MTDENYINLQGWMVTRLHLKDKELMAYALMYGFCQGDNGCYTGSYKYIAEWLGCCERTAFTVVENLEKKGLICHTQTVKEGKTYNTYYLVKSEAPAKQEEKPKTTRAKKVPLMEREPVNDIERVEKKYLQNYRHLHDVGKMTLQEPVVPWQKAVVLIKACLASAGLEKTCEALDKAMQDSWILSTGYALTTILSGNVFSRLMNATTSGVGVGVGVDSVKTSDFVEF